MRIKGEKDLIVWDKETGKQLGKFNSEGLLDTEDADVIEKFSALGYVCEVVEDDHNTFKSMKVEELKEYAIANGIDLGDSTKKPEILAVILASVDGGAHADS